MVIARPEIQGTRRILMLPASIGLAYLTRLLLVARKLRDHGAEVTFAFKEKNRLLEHYDFPVFHASDVTVTDFSGNVFAAYTPEFVEQCVEEELKAIKSFQPDAIVGDLRPTAAISSRIAGIPYISVVNGYMTDYFNPVDVMIPKERSVFKHAIASIVGRGIQAVQKRALATPFRTVARKYGIKNLVSLYDFLKGDLTLIPDLPQFCPLEKLPANYRYIGPLIWEGTNGSVPDYLEKRDQAKPLIYATTGNTGKERLIQLVVDAFKEDDFYEVVMTTGAYIEPSNITRTPNIHIERFIPGSLILRHCVAAIHCGGNGTSYQVISQGVPSVVIPFNNDQGINAWLIKRRRLGIPLSPSGLTGNQVRLAVQKVLQDADIRLSLQRFQELLADADGPKSAVDEIISFLTVGA